MLYTGTDADWGGLAVVVAEKPHFIKHESTLHSEACMEVTMLTDKSPAPPRQKERHRIGGVSGKQQGTPGTCDAQRSPRT